MINHLIISANLEEDSKCHSTKNKQNNNKSSTGTLFKGTTTSLRKQNKSLCFIIRRFVGSRVTLTLRMCGVQLCRAFIWLHGESRADVSTQTWPQTGWLPGSPAPFCGLSSGFKTPFSVCYTALSSLTCASPLGMFLIFTFHFFLSFFELYYLCRTCLSH